MNFLIHLSGVNSKAKMLPMIEHNCSSNSSYCKLSNWYSYPISCSENIPIYYIYGSWNYILSAEYMCIHTHIMAPHSSTLAWKIPLMEEPSRLQSHGSLRVGHDWVTSLWLFTFMHWRRKWQPTSVYLPGESQGRGSLVGCRLWGHTESDTTEVT